MKGVWPIPCQEFNLTWGSSPVVHCKPDSDWQNYLTIAPPNNLSLYHRQNGWAYFRRHIVPSLFEEFKLYLGVKSQLHVATTMFKHLICTSTLLLLALSAQAQNDAEKPANTFWSRIFLPSIDIGYQVPNSDLIDGSVRIGTSIEYRIRNNNDFFLRLNYDTYSARYSLLNGNSTTNTIEGTAQFQDILFGPGYRLGDNTFRLMFAAMPGIKLYEFPTATVDGQNVEVRQEGKSTFTTVFMSTLEYYFDEKSALTLTLYQNQVWKKTDFWDDGASAVGFSIGFITSLM